MTTSLPILQTSTIDPDHPEHWQIGCSNAKRWVRCPGSKYAKDEREPGFMAAMGTLGHKVVESFLRAHFNQEGIGSFLTEEDHATLAEFDSTQIDWFKTAIKICYDAVVEIADGADEVSLEFKTASTKVENHGGTCDVVLWFEKLKLLIVIDFKFGSSPVDCKDNEQIMCYLNLARQRYPQAKKFQGVIVQPSYGGVDRETFSKRQLDMFTTEQIAAADPENMERHGDPDRCEYCPLLATCDAAAKMTVSAVDEFGTLPDVINEASGDWTPERLERLERIVLMHKLAKTAYDKASTLLKQLHADGHELVYHRVTSSNYRSWKPSAEEQIKLLYGSDVMTESVMSPNELQNLLGMKKKEFDEAHSHMLDLTCRPTLKAGVKPNAGELASDLPIYEG